MFPFTTCLTGSTDSGGHLRIPFRRTTDRHENFFTTRLDHRFSDKDNLSATYLFDKTPYSTPDGVNDVLLGSKTSRQIASLEETHIFKPTFANTARFGYNYEIADVNEGLKALVPEAADTSLGAFPGRNAAQVFISRTYACFWRVGGGSTYLYHWNSYQSMTMLLSTKARIPSNSVVSWNGCR